MADPKTNSADLQSQVSKIIGSTNKILVGLNMAFLGIKAANLTDNIKDPILRAVQLFTIVNMKTAKVAGQLATLPDVSTARDNVEVTLSKLNSINTPNAKASFASLIAQYKSPAESIKTQLNALETLRTGYKQHVENQHESIFELVKKLQESKDPAALIRSQEILNEYAKQEKVRESLVTNMINIGRDLLGTQATLTTIFKQALASIPPEDRRGIAAKITPMANDEYQPNKPE